MAAVPEMTVTVRIDAAVEALRVIRDVAALASQDPYPNAPLACRFALGKIERLAREALAKAEVI